MFELKPLSQEAVAAALEKAMRYRLLNEPAEAESICHDVLRVDPENQQALVILLLALTDRFGKGYGVGVLQAQEVLPRLRDAYERAYYAGIICERQAKARLRRAARTSRPMNARSDGLVRKGRSGSPGRKRRHAPALERLRPHHHGQPTRAADGGEGRAAIGVVGIAEGF
jgi:hypothetical protein